MRPFVAWLGVWRRLLEIIPNVRNIAQKTLPDHAKTNGLLLLTGQVGPEDACPLTEQI